MTQDQGTSKLQSLIVRLCKPLVRFAMERGFRFQELSEALKSACLEVADEKLGRKGVDSNTSRLSVLTGLQRKEIKRLSSTEQTELSNPNLLNRLIGKWQNDPKYSTKSGSPKVLDFEGADSDFAELVKAVSVDVNPYTVLFGLEESGAVMRDGKKVRLVAPIYNTSRNVMESLAILAQDVDTLHQSVSENVFQKPEVPNLHLTTYYDNINVEALPEIREWLLEKGFQFHEEVRAYLAQRDKDTNPGLFEKEGGAKVTLSAFSLTEAPVTKSEENEEE